MECARKHGYGFVINTETNPQGTFLEMTPELWNKVNSFYKPNLNEDVTDFIETATAQEVNAEKTKIYLAKIQQLYSSMWLSSLSRATGKTGSKEELEAVREEYLDKYTVSKEVVNSQMITNQSLLNEMIDEMDRDFAGDLMVNTIIAINQAYGQSIPTNLTRFEMFCHLVIFKYEAGEVVWKRLKAYCSYFRTTCITDIEQLDFAKCDQRIALAYEITNESTLEDIDALVQQSKAL